MWEQSDVEHMRGRRPWRTGACSLRNLFSLLVTSCGVNVDHILSLGLSSGVCAICSFNITDVGNLEYGAKPSGVEPQHTVVPSQVVRYFLFPAEADAAAQPKP